MIKLSIIIVNWNTMSLLQCCLRSLKPEIDNGESEIIVVDNASSDGAIDMVRTEFPTVTLIANSKNLSFATGTNQGLSEASGKFVMLLNPDTELTEGTTERLMKFLDTHSDAAAAAPKLIYPDGLPQQSCRTFPTPSVLFIEALGLERLFPKSKLFGRYRMGWFNYDETHEVDQPMASCLMIRRTALDQIGHMDEEFPLFFNDVDLCLRLKGAGWKVFFTPAAVVVHHHGASTRQLGKELIRESHRSLLLFYRKHYRNRLNILIYAMSCTLIQLGGIMRTIALRGRGENNGPRLATGDPGVPDLQRRD